MASPGTGSPNERGERRDSKPAQSPVEKPQGSPAQPRSPGQGRSGRSGGSELKLASGRFILKNKLGGGSFGEIFRGVDVWRNKEVAVKLELIKTRHPQLNYESRVYKLLHNGSTEVIGIPEVHWAGQEGEFNAMVMDLLGPCLEDLFNYCMRKFSLKTILMLADQMMHRMEFIHKKQFIHRDIKPENFVMGTGSKGHHLFLLDFGLSKKFWDARTKAHIQFKEGKALTGTARYCSANAHRGIEVSRRDDLESIGYLLLYFYKGSLPWQGLNAPDAHAKTVKIGEKKMQTPLEELCKDAPQQFLQFLRYSRQLRFEDEPDYDLCRGWFREVMEQHNYDYDWNFDWVVKRELETKPPDSESQGEYSLSSNQGFADESTSQRLHDSAVFDVNRDGASPARTPNANAGANDPLARETATPQN